MNMGPIMKKPKKVKQENEEMPLATLENSTSVNNSLSEEEEDDEEAILVALFKHREHEVEHNRTRVKYYQDQLAKSEKNLEDVKAKLVRIRRKNNTTEKLKICDVKSSTEKTSLTSGIRESSPENQLQLQVKPRLVIPATKAKTSQIVKNDDSTPVSKVKISKAVKIEDSTTTPPVTIQDSGRKRKHEHKEHTELISMVRSSSLASTIHCQMGCLIPSQHKRKLRSLVLCPTNDQLFMTSSLDGVINLWQLQGRGTNASLLSSTDSVSPKQRRWPEDTAWHPDGGSLFSVYSADGDDSQISVLNLKKKKLGQICFLEEKPHSKGIINNIVFMPWENVSFVTGGNDHAVMLWTEKEGENSCWKPKALHRKLHSSAVMGVTGMQQKQTVLSVGSDKRIIGFDAVAERVDYEHRIESKCMSVLPNPCDFNLFMVQTGTPERQLRLFDIRVKKTEIHDFGWKQESSESQSALISQTWSPDGLYITSGSADPMIHIFDIRYHGNNPSQSVRAHTKRVFKAVWHQNYPLLISISSDLNVGLHHIT
ncbi:uncharacterized protein LOC124944380 isoform X2 [Impatiens glandulifera]|uniref:uncharacterized protein LOC124944380 isoform X2 n=1 Tax=Impatiens glandulifera TaxID=253017 RepID=UPI001FB09DF1|nr:uncharacterized protein LOC124944380 isoform X2 [Impatiens glandulifera]